MPPLRSNRPFESLIVKCRHCSQELRHTFLDLGCAPPSNAYLTLSQLHAPETWYPLRLLVCDRCWLVQTEDYAKADSLFGDDYAYFSSFSDSWLVHAKNYVESVLQRFALNASSQVVEIAANDGYLLQYVKAAGIPCLGVEPTASTAAAARAKGIPIVEAFFGRALAEELRQAGQGADLITANNVLAHVPDINDFTAGFHALLKPQGVATFEFPHLLRLVQFSQFDTVYHEHYSYLSLRSVSRIFATNGLSIFDVEELPTHGGSLRVYAQRTDTGQRPAHPRVGQVLAAETDAGMETLAFYLNFQAQAEGVKDELLTFLLQTKRQGLKIAAYGAAAKGNTLLNFAGIRPDMLPYVVDRNPAKQGKFMPGSRTPIVSEERLKEHQPDYILLLPWNLRDELTSQLAYARNWGARFVTAVPELEIA